MRFGFGWLRLHYLLLFAVVGAYLPYMPVYLNELGMSDWQIGWVSGVYGLSVILMPAVIAYLADRHASNKVLIGVGYALAAAGLTAIALVSFDAQSHAAEVVAGVDAAAGKTHLFIVLLTLSLLFSMAYTPMFSQLDGLTFGTLADAETAGVDPPRYHRLRLWGSWGFMLPAVALYLLMQFTEATSVWAIVTAAACAAVAALTAPALPNTGRARPDETTAASDVDRAEPDDSPTNDEPAPSRRVMPSTEAWRVMSRGPVVHLVVPLIMLFLAISIFYSFYSRQLQHLDIDRKWIGLIVNIGVLCEVLLIMKADVLLNRLGLRGVLILGAAGMVLRLGLLAVVPTVPVAIATQVLHAPIVLALYFIPPMYLNLKAAPAFRNSMQGLYGMLCFGLARFIGSIAGGYFATLSLEAAMAFGATLALVATAWLIVAFRDDDACDKVRAQHAKPKPRATTTLDA
ncbi:MAG: hypothetical protein GC159_10495 [Phycisphaera sp.]|nr:hypothetical protein [Phycisphaera sp.]